MGSEMTIKNFYKSVLGDYEKNLGVFFDPDTGAVVEPGREDGTPRFLFTEVTGYAILDDLTLLSLTGNRRYLAKAKKSAEWIMSHAQDPSGGVLTRYYFERDGEPDLADKSFAGRRIFSFDVAICLRGMVALYRFAGDEPVLRSAIRMGDYLVERVISPKGEVDAIYDAAMGEPVPAEQAKWSRRFGAFHSKVAEALIDLYEATNQEKYFSAAESICRNVLQFQSLRGNFETSSGRTELHPHCYATEGLLHVGRKTNNDVLIESARRATEWALGHCKEGEIPQVIDSSEDVPLARFRTDALSQVLALAADLMQMGRLDSAWQPVMDRLAAKLLEMKKGGDGYFQYGFYEREFQGKLEADTQSYWTNMFCLRGLSKYYLSSILNDTYVAILAGGIGSRVWPISCENRPKPVSYSLLGDRSLLQETIRRFTYDYFIRPDRIFILCSANALDKVSDQAGQEGVPIENCVIEKEPKGTIPAVGLALDGLPIDGDQQNRMVIISMGDNVIAPYARFQDAVACALITARENSCIVSIGKPADKNAIIDIRFGHHLYTRKLHSYRSYEVPRFIEKPGQEDFEEVRNAPGSLAWECGAIVFNEFYYRKLVPGKPQSGNLAENLLSRAAPWKRDDDGQVRLATSILDPEARFEDFGVPGTSVKRFYQGHDRFDRGDGNVCLGQPEKVKLLSCADNLVISDDLPIEIIGLRNHVVIDNAMTNTAVVMPIEEVRHLPNLYRLFSGSKRYEAFIEGGPKALVADPTTFVEKSPDVSANSDFGLVFAYNIKEKLSIRRNKRGLRIVNGTYPALHDNDFNVLMKKQAEDPRLVEHLIDVGTLAKALVGGSVALSETGADLLNKLCLYHAIGGYLTAAGEREEAEAITRFRAISKLDRRFLDSRVVDELMTLYGRSNADSNAASAQLLSDNVNSAVAFLRAGVVENPDFRDILVALIQVQDNPHAFAAFRKDVLQPVFAELEDEIVRVFACFKVAKNIVMGRWLWRRRNLKETGAAQGVFLQHDRGDLEDLPFILSFTVKWLVSAGIDPQIYVDRVNEILARNDQVFIGLIHRLQGGTRMLWSGVVYLAMVTEGPGSDRESIARTLEEAVEDIEKNPDQYFQYSQILELPFLLEDVAPVCSSITQGSIAMVRELIVDWYHKNWRKIKPHVHSGLVSRLVS